MKDAPNRIAKISSDALQNPTAKRSYNRQLFKEVAPQYTRITRLMSFGRDKTWKRQLVGMLPCTPSPSCLDIACGTGDIILALLERFADARIRGVDLSEDMLAICRDRCLQLTDLEILCEDMNAVSAADESFDFITGGYALRNSPDLRLTLREIQRMLKPEGTAAFLDFSRSNSRFLHAIQLGLLSIWGKLWGLLLHRNPNIYGYIAESLKTFPARSQLESLCHEAGLVMKQRKLLFFGFIEIILIERSAAHRVHPGGGKR